MGPDFNATTRKCAPPNLNVGINAQNRIIGNSYDDAGNMTWDPGSSQTFAWDAESRMKSTLLWDWSLVYYTYDANGMRVRKQSDTETTEYIYFAGQPIAERNATNGDWSDYIFAGGRRLARADSYEYRIRINGNNGSAGLQSRYTFPNNPLVNGYVIRAGDPSTSLRAGRIYLRQETYQAARPGIVLKFTDGTDTRNNTNDQNGNPLNCDQAGTWSWHLRYADLSAHAGKTIQDVQLVNDTCGGAGAFWATFTDIAIASTDGAVRPIYNRQKAMTLSVSCDTGVTDCWQIVGHPTNVGWAHFSTTTYYHGDHLGSSRFLSSYNGTPMWEATYLPYGQEWNPPSGSGPVSPNHYKFTGKERDGESGLDYFGARFYASALGRFLSPDPLLGSEFHIKSPQRWNGYSYGQNNPANRIDIGGYFDIPVHKSITGGAFYRLGYGATYGLSGRGATILNANIGVDKTVSGHFAGNRQREHFMAARGEKQIDAVRNGRDHIADLAQRAHRRFSAGGMEDGDKAVGKALHAIQDGFAHTKRNAEGKITFIETFLRDHDHPDTFEGSQFHTEIRGATDATVAFLQLMQDSSGMTAQQFGRALQSFLDTYFGWGGRAEVTGEDTFKQGENGTCGIKQCAAYERLP